ncbi:hypothetical protein [Streptomyces griseorubiginosus]|uniref:hypothetical protein n=1 Tax=Streptomyces griseorubiginosus TaxID=67304 RepID=UPI003321698B
MTTATKTLPAHGTYARGNGAPGYRKPCKCVPCYKAMRRARKQYAVNRQLGRPGLVDAAPARQHLQLLQLTMTWGQICEASECQADNLRSIAAGRHTQIRRETHNRIMAVKAQAPAPGKYVDATGLRRRLQALRAIGWSAQILAAKAGSAEARIQRICAGEQPTVRQVLAEKILKLYAELSQTPAPAGRSATRAKNHAIANGWAPPVAWDDDTIDDPAAQPELTGHCGSDRGYWMHRNQKLPVCPRCEQAHTDWLTERAHLTPQQLNQERFRARAAAASREADLAHDARELMRLGADYEQAAARLDVTRQHLQQALLRHPETAPQQDDMEAAA